MIQVDFAILPLVLPAGFERTLEDWFISAGLSMTLKGTLVKYPGCTHWHWKHGQERGTLEITCWPAQQRLWYKVQAGREGDWISDTVRRLQSALESGLIFKPE